MDFDITNNRIRQRLPSTDTKMFQSNGTIKLKWNRFNMFLKYININGVFTEMK